MINEEQLQKDASRAVRAQHLLENEILKEAFVELRAAYLEQWESTTVDQQFLREKYWLAHRIVGVVESHLSKIIANGRLANQELANLAQLGEQPAT